MSPMTTLAIALIFMVVKRQERRKVVALVAVVVAQTVASVTTIASVSTIASVTTKAEATVTTIAEAIPAKSITISSKTITTSVGRIMLEGVSLVVWTIVGSRSLDTFISLIRIVCLTLGSTQIQN